MSKAAQQNPHYVLGLFLDIQMRTSVCSESHCLLYLSINVNRLVVNQDQVRKGNHKCGVKQNYLAEVMKFQRIASWGACGF